MSSSMRASMHVHMCVPHLWQRLDAHVSGNLLLLYKSNEVNAALLFGLCFMTRPLDEVCIARQPRIRYHQFVGCSFP